MEVRMVVIELTKSLALVVALSIAAQADTLAKRIKDSVSLAKADKVSIASNNGEFTVISTDAKVISYDVEFLSEGKSFFWPKKVTSEALEDSSVTFNQKENRLVIQAGNKLKAKAFIYIPRDIAVDVKADNGIVSIQARAGFTEASLANGILTFNASALPQNAWVDAAVDNGRLSNARNKNTGQKAQAVLRLSNGILRVE